MSRVGNGSFPMFCLKQIFLLERILAYCRISSSFVKSVSKTTCHLTEDIWWLNQVVPDFNRESSDAAVSLQTLSSAEEGTILSGSQPIAVPPL